MNPPCAGCKKTVYPTEKFNCLDKSWHKGCFKCSVCNLKLTMKTYKGYQKMPYCNTHYPTIKHTSISDTPENQRLAKQSKAQSQIEYHKDFEKAKGMKTSVADDPETLRNLNVSQQQSTAQYTNRQGRKADEEMRRQHVENPDEQARVWSGGAYQGGPPPQMAPPPQQAAYQQPPAPEPVYEPEPEPEPEPYYEPESAPSGGDGGEKRFKALYDYTAADDDELSFAEDEIFLGFIVDEGWLEGRILSRNDGQGMVPRNYFEEL